MKKTIQILGLFATLMASLLLSGCEWDVLKPAGYVAHQERTLIFICVAVMLCVVIPVMIAIVVFAIKFRSTNTQAQYLPDWGTSHRVEMCMWGIPIVIIIVLACLTGYYTFRLEPSRLLSAEVAGDEQPIQIDAVALDWKWLFIYPQYGVASINEIYAPANRQVFLQLSSENSINAFWVPKLGTVLYAMPQMNSKLHLVASEQGQFNGVSANYSGDGFADMRFKWHSVTQQGFDNWIAQLKQSNKTLDRAGYLTLSQAPQMGDVAGKEKDAQVRYFSSVDKDLYYRIVNRCVADGKECNERLMARDAANSLWGQLCSVFDADYKFDKTTPENGA